MNIIILSFTLYIIVSLGFTIWVGHNLHKNGRVFLMDAFSNDELKADSVNQLLLVGFYLVNFGIVCLFLTLGSKPTNAVDVFEYLSIKFGVVLIVLGFMHFYNMKNLSRFRSKELRKTSMETA